MGERSFLKLSGFVLLAALSSGAMFFQQVGSGMVGFWRCEETAGPSLDTSGASPANNGTWSAGVSALAGPANTPAALGANSTQCLNFNGTTGVVSIPHAASITLTGDMTVALWIYKNSEAADWVRLIGKGLSANRTFGVWEESGGGTRILFQQYGTANLNLYSTGTIPLTTWTHVTCRISGNNATIFINGANSGSTTRGGAPATDTEPVTLGYAGFHTYWPGRMDDVRLYNRALSDAEISALASGGQGPMAPTSLMATAGSNQVTLNWSGSATVYNVKRSTVSGGPYTTIQSNVATNSYVDSTAVSGTTYYYVVSGVTYGEGPNSSQVSAMPLPVIAQPSSGLFTSEVPTSTSFNIVFGAPAPAGGSVVTVTSSSTLEGVVSTTYAGGGTPIAGGFQVTVPAGTTPSIPVTVTGVDDSLDDGNVNYTVNVTESGFGFAIPPVQVTNNDNDTPNITISRTSGLVTTEAGGQDTFAVSLTTQPYGTITMGLSSSRPAEGTVSPTGLTFNAGNWNTPQVVTVTGVNDTVLDFGQFYTIVTTPLNAPNASDAPYAAVPTPDVSVLNNDDEAIPALDPVWGGGGGGCGLLGLEILLPLLLLRLTRRRD